MAGYIFLRGADRAEDAPGDHLGIGGTEKTTTAGRLFFSNGDVPREVLAGTTEIRLKTWNHVVTVRHGKTVTVYLTGNTPPEISGEAAPGPPAGVEQLFIGGRNDSRFNFEGKIDEVAVYNRALTGREVARHFAASGLSANAPPAQT